MKKLKLFVFILLFLAMPGFILPTNATTVLEVNLLPPDKAFARGAATPSELAQSLIQAIQENDFTRLNTLLLAEKEIVLLKNKGSEDMKAFLENTSATDLKNTFQQKYQALISQALTQTINWSDFQVSEARLGKGTAKNPFLQPLTIFLTDKQNQPLELILETVMLNKRYFLFRQIELKTPKKT